MFVDNNFTESFNAWILDTRYKPIIKILKDIRVKVKVMEMLREHEDKVKSWTADFSLYAMKLYEGYLRIAHKCVVHFNGDWGYEISEGLDKHIVNMVLKQCSCKSWQLSGIPCPHAIRAFEYKSLDPLQGIHWWYSKETTLKTYSHKILPVREEKFWKVVPADAMEPPQIMKLAGRPKVKKTREKDEAIKRQREWSMLRKGRVMNCSNY
ncbi:uncharacterized protein LOC142164029 [Nicotiana tabacum]|uniref:Uncharacterized protein LOC142164029 n=1 Tax=Nicotiana tabacum TaxID=4097 RepID=A0AC58RX29_TOBAC